MGDEGQSDTPIVCEACGGTPDNRVACFWCDRTGLMSNDRLALYRASRQQRITGQFQAYRSIVVDMIRALRERNQEFPSALADEGQVLVDRYDALMDGPSSRAAREKGVQELRAYEERLVDYFAGKR